MCGIVVATSYREVVPMLLEGLSRLEYRGYDSCGSATLDNGVLKRARTVSHAGSSRPRRRTLCLCGRDSAIASEEHVHVIRLPENYGDLSPVLHVVTLQLFAYHVAVNRGEDVDKPRNLAKSVTVE